MRRMVLLTLIGCAVSIARGQAEVHLANGAVMAGNVVEDDGAKVKVALIADGDTGARRSTRTSSSRRRRSTACGSTRRSRTTSKARSISPAYALDNGVFPSARLSYDLAKKANEKKKAGMEKDLEKLYARAPAAVSSRAKKEIDTKASMRAEINTLRAFASFSRKATRRPKAARSSS